MTTLLWQTALLLLGAYFLGAWVACITRRAIYSARKASTVPALVLPPTAETPPPPPQRLPDLEPVAPRIEPVAAPLPAPAAAETKPKRPAALDAVAPPASRPASAASPAIDSAARAAAVAARAPAQSAPSAPPTGPVNLPAAAGSFGQSSTFAPRPQAAMAADDLTRIRGIDESLEAKLRQLKVDRYADIAAWRAADVRRVGEALGLEGRIERENWIEQAQILAAGGETAFASRLRRGELASAEPTPDEGEPPAVAPIGQDGGKGEPAVVESVKSDDVGRSASPPAEADVVRRSDVTGLRSVRSEALRGADGAPAAQMRPVRGPGLDDLKRIRGIGVMIERKLNGLGVASYEQIANWTMADIERVSRVLDFKGRIERENWVEQARILASGGQTEFARRVERGEIETSRSRSS